MEEGQKWDRLQRKGMVYRIQGKREYGEGNGGGGIETLYPDVSEVLY